jgi:hypothetical protein
MSRKSLIAPFALTIAALSASLAAPLAHAGPFNTALTNVTLNKADLQLVVDPAWAIQSKANALNAAHPGFTGSAVSGLETVTRGYRIRYQGCDIYYSSSTGAHEVHGDIRAKYNAKGGPNSDLALPITDETTTPDGIGRFNHFSGNGSIYWTPNTGPMEVRGGIRANWASGGWELGPLGYPVGDEHSLGSSKWFSDFQNGVLYFETDHIVPTANASLSGSQMANAVKNFFVAHKNDDGLSVDSVSITGVSNTGYGFWNSRNRLVTFHFEGEHDSGHWYIPDPDYEMDLRLLFYGKKEADGSTSLWVALDHWHIYTSGIGHDDLLNGLKNGILNIFASPVKLGDNIPAACNLLSFKMMPDGGLTIFLQPGGAAALCQLAIQNQLNAMAN